MKNSNSTLLIWERLSSFSLGKSLFSLVINWKAPYFSSINARFNELRPGYCKISVKKKRKLMNHIGTVHAIAMCNMAELAGGTMTDVTIPNTHRWIPKGMSVEYLAKAETDLYAVTSLDPIPTFDGSLELPVTVNINDVNDQTVLKAVITMWISSRAN